MAKNRILYLIFMALTFYFAYDYVGIVPDLLFYVVWFLPIFSFIYTAVIYFRFKYAQEIDKKVAVKGERIRYVFRMYNEDPLLYPYIRLQFYGMDTIFGEQLQTKVLSLLPFEKKDYEFDLECTCRGNYLIGIRSIEIEDFLGIFRFSYQVSEPKSMTVYPKVVGLQHFYLQNNFLTEIESSLNGTYDGALSTTDLRKYAYGDPFKRIHWKLSAKHQGFMVKNFENTVQTSTTFLLDLGRNPYSIEENTLIEDKLVESAVSLLQYCFGHWIPASLVCYNEQMQVLEGKNPLDFEGFYEFLSEVKFHSKVSIKDVIRMHLKEHTEKSNLLIFTSQITDGLYSEIYKVKLSKYEVDIVYVYPPKLKQEQLEIIDDIISSWAEIGVKTYRIHLQDDIKMILER